MYVAFVKDDGVVKNETKDAQKCKMEGLMGLGPKIQIFSLA